MTPARRVFGSIRLRHFGPRPLIEDNSAQSAPTTIWNGEIGLRINERMDVVLEGYNLLDSDVSDIDYFYTSRPGRGSPRTAWTTSTSTRRFPARRASS